MLVSCCLLLATLLACGRNTRWVGVNGRTVGATQQTGSASSVSADAGTDASLDASPDADAAGRVVDASADGTTPETQGDEEG